MKYRLILDKNRAMFLKAEDLTELTGYVRPSAQRRWLTRNGIRFWVRADGKLAVLTAQMQIRKNSSAPQDWQPDLSVLERER